MLRRTLLWAGVCTVALVSVVQALTKGHDLSSAPLMETEQGTIWYNTAGKERAIEDVLGEGGMDSVRLRYVNLGFPYMYKILSFLLRFSLWTGEEYGLNYTLSLAQRYSKKGYKIFLDLHFSDTWAQPSDQLTPSTWDNSSVEALAKACRDHVSSTLKAFTDGGVELDILSIGNEITAGFLYPTGKISNDDFGPFAKLWKAARQGVTDAVKAGTTQPKVMIHLDNGWMEETVMWFFKGLFAEGTVTTEDVDVFGFSYYPYYNVNATLDALTSSLTTMANTYKKPIYVAETDWPTNCTTVTLSEKYPVSARGQREWVMAIMDVLEGLPNGLGAGIFYWEPGYISVPGLGSECGSNLLFSVNWDNWPDTYAKALSSIYMFSNGSTPSTTSPAPQTQQNQLNFSQLDQSSSSTGTQQTQKDDAVQQQ
ncbi:putative arabinogalactan endo-beta-1 [Phytophthora citrophthora]|uniref:arabinogalactan endo-beta-1,4-galactanase n=1 Tax=Phytophthora citrophthora TaxID=4793 RepID=A0AAD9G5V1_9STRA|nr:putative arabinogalactan endo-beta-1 [Phytophthora citrophthora]